MEWRNMWLVRWMRVHVSDPLVEILQRGADPKTLAVSGALGLTVGVFPIYGVTALLCTCLIAALGARCNAPTMLIVNLLATPLELALVVPFLRVGEFVVQGDHFPLTKDSLWKALTGQGSKEVFIGLFHAVLGWGLVAPFMAAALYILLLPVMRLAVQAYRHTDATGSYLSPLIKDQSV